MADKDTNTIFTNVVFLFIGIVSGFLAALLSYPALIALAVILITTPLTQTIVDDMLVEKWNKVTIIFLLTVFYISVGIWAINSLVEAESFQDRAGQTIIVIGAGVIQMAWIFLTKITIRSNNAR